MGVPLGSPQAPLAPLTHTKLKKPCMAKIALVAAKITCVLAIIMRFTVKSGICGDKHLLAQKQINTRSDILQGQALFRGVKQLLIRGVW